jgi:hypothetical protein
MTWYIENVLQYYVYLNETSFFYGYKKQNKKTCKLWIDMSEISLLAHQVSTSDYFSMVRLIHREPRRVHSLWSLVDTDYKHIIIIITRVYTRWNWMYTLINYQKIRSLIKANVFNAWRNNIGDKLKSWSNRKNKMRSPVL